MQYNMHPLFVHFPVALLSLFAVLVVLPLEKWFATVSWLDIKRIVLFCGVIGAFLALQTGEIAEHLVKPNRDLVELHSTFATVTTWIFAVIALYEVLSLVEIRFGERVPRLIRVFYSYAYIVFSKKIIYVSLVWIGLITLVITGLLGGTLVYGTSADPLSPYVLRLFGISL
jgi:uncharacterized membrane protein